MVATVVCEYSGDVLGFNSGLFHTQCLSWNRVRNIASPTLVKYRITQNVKEMCNEAASLVDRISLEADGKTEVNGKLENGYVYNTYILH